MGTSKKKMQQAKIHLVTISRKVLLASENICVGLSFLEFSKPCVSP